MSMSVLLPTAPTTLVILLGASAWPNAPDFQESKAFVNATQKFRNYVLDQRGLGVPEENLFDLFDITSGASDQLEMLSSFLEQRTQALKGVNQATHDVLLYFVGHGSFTGPSADFYLLPRRANASSLKASGIAIDALAEVLREKARHTRRYLFLDCGFAATAFRSFQGGPDQAAITKTLAAFQVQIRSRGFPSKGTVILCLSDQKSPSLLLHDQSCTIFTHTLLDVLQYGDSHRPLQLSLRDVKELAENRLAAQPEKKVPHFGLYSPDQSEGDVADVPLFPNSQAREQRHRQAIEAEQARHVSRRAVIASIAATGVAVVGVGGSMLLWRASQAQHPAPLSTSIATLAHATQFPTSPSPTPQIGTLFYTYNQGGTVWSVAWSPNEQRIASGGDGSVQVWNSSDGENPFVYSSHLIGQPVSGVAWSPDGKRVACTDGKSITVWDQSDGGNMFTYQGHTSSTIIVAWSPDGKRIVSGSADETAQVWDASDGSNVFIYRGHYGSGVYGVAWSPDGKRIASGGDSPDQTVQVWDASDGGNTFIYRGHKNRVNGVAWSPDGKRIASASADGTVQVWDASDGGKVIICRVNGEANGVAWSPDGKRIASADVETVTIWDANNGENLFVYPGYTDGVMGVVWSPDGKRIAFAGFDGTVPIWSAL